MRFIRRRIPPGRFPGERERGKRKEERNTPNEKSTANLGRRRGRQRHSGLVATTVGREEYTIGRGRT